MPDWINVLIKGTYNPSFICRFPLLVATCSFLSDSEDIISKMLAEKEE